MIRVDRVLIASALLGGAVLMSVAPAHAVAVPQSHELHPIGTGAIASGSADLNNFFCGTIWRPVCFPDGLPS
ncbi:hypothetical protein [Nocardia rosealba]|uniref:hypothetical protein n=1 Tax=Nocardia TaxID=1817 RepID=UPI001CD9F145|nr:hypothetical protein [Nocardia rosealba]MCA2207842.1 hypothetical protein [Nocardia rosealba]